jgi:aminoglycoside phosphotransferase (APT) family kinase protein
VLLAQGSDADVYSIGNGRVLRRYRDGTDASAEAALMADLAARGYPVPAVRAMCGPEIVMDLVDGPTMLDALLTRSITNGAAGEILSELHHRLHALGVVHLDLHPANVILGAGGPVVIDWRNAASGDPAVDVALTSVIIAAAAVIDAPTRTAVDELLQAFLWSEVAPQGPLVTEDALAAATDFRRSDRNLSPDVRASVEHATAVVRKVLTRG